MDYAIKDVYRHLLGLDEIEVIGAKYSVMDLNYYFTFRWRPNEWTRTRRNYSIFTGKLYISSCWSEYGRKAI